ncbi:hypothetical protein METHB2_70006 [Candidatus Methylobacter favarea]|uniref:Uncharacterized protein n=1 Tax=Candidatus Methylobacter favarea TaxID=2707345 RepID=A0A8S0Y6X3_9GAMM|nr:hypothetical protein METHB2_70006 [Candidatus Methylobacter favarea]
MHAKGALKEFMPGSRRGLDSVLPPGASNQNAEKEELENRQYRNDMHLVHSGFLETFTAANYQLIRQICLIS